MRNRTLRRTFAAMSLTGLLWVLAAPAEAACLMKVPPPNERVAPVLALVPESEVSDYLKDGFRRAKCPTDMKRVSESIRQTCQNFDFAAIRSRYGAAESGRQRERICKSAQKVIGASR